MARHDLSDDEWLQIKAALPSGRRRGRPWRSHRQVVNGMLLVLATGAPWRDDPRRYGPWQTVYDRFDRWRADGTFERITATLRERLDRACLIDWDLWCIDGASVRASRAAAGGDKGGARRSLKTTHSATRAVASERSSTS